MKTGNYKWKVRVLPLFLAAALLLSACSNGPKKDVKLEKAAAAYAAELADDSADYFGGIVENAVGSRPAEVTTSFRHAGWDFVKAPAKSFEEILSGGGPLYLIGLDKGDDGKYSEEEIKSIVRETVRLGISVEYYFDGDTSCLYRVEDGKAVTDRETAKDGGAMRVTEDYPLD